MVLGRSAHSTGSELNQATHSFNYNSLGHYVVIFWAQNQASVIEMNSITGRPGPIQQSGRDQEGRPWEILLFPDILPVSMIHRFPPPSSVEVPTRYIEIISVFGTFEPVPPGRTLPAHSRALGPAKNWMPGFVQGRP